MEDIISSYNYQQFNNLEFIAKEIVEGFITGYHKSPFHGFSVEFAEHSIYNPGEPTRHIDWKLYSRTDKLFIKRFEEETNLRCQLVVDASSSMYYPELNKNYSINKLNKISFSVFASAAFIYLLHKQRDAIGLSVFSDNLDFNSNPRSSSIYHKLLYNELNKLLTDQNLKQNKTTNVAQSLHLIAESLHKRSLIIIFSDMVETAEDINELFLALQHLRHYKNEVILFHTVDKSTEINFDFDKRFYKFIDLETNDVMSFHTNDVKEQYIRAVKQHYEEVKARATQYHIDFVEVDINKGFEQILLPYLNKRAKLY